MSVRLRVLLINAVASLLWAAFWFVMAVMIATTAGMLGKVIYISFLIGWNTIR